VTCLGCKLTIKTIIAARFVSGYYYFDMDEQLTNYMRGGRFIPGIGWLV
jgi:hypothetical protein